MSTTAQRLTLPADLLAVIKTISSDADLPPRARLLGVLTLVWGWSFYTGHEQIDPTAMALPESQWVQVAQLLHDGVAADSLAGVNLALSFMNSGPSSYIE